VKTLTEVSKARSGDDIRGIGFFAFQEFG